jgi:hypothetical protein
MVPVPGYGGFPGYDANIERSSQDNAALIAGFLKGTKENLVGKVTTPYHLTKDALASFQAGKPIGFYADLVEMARRVSANPTAVPGQVMNALQAQFSQSTSSPEEFGKFLGSNVDPTNMFRKGGPVMAGIFAGERSATWDAARAAERARLEAQGGLSDQDIWRQTGTWVGPDGKLRQEIDDSVAVVTQPNVRPGNTFNGKVEDILHHPELFAAYPWMKDLNLEVGGSVFNNGSFNPVTGQVFVNGNLFLSPNAAKITLMHELQHVVQDYEHFAPGGAVGISKQLAQKAINREKVLGPPAFPEQAQFDLLQQQLQQKYRDLNSVDWLNRPIEQLNRYNVGGRLIKPADFLDSISGASMKYWKDYGDEITKKIGRPPNAAKYPAAYSAWAINAGKELVDVIKRKGPDLNASSIQDEINSISAQLNTLRNSPQFNERLRNFNSYNTRQNYLKSDPITGPPAEYDVYRLLGGEAESRATQARLLLNQAQRQQSYPGASYDVPTGHTFNALYPDLLQFMNVPFPPGTIPGKRP